MVCANLTILWLRCVLASLLGVWQGTGALLKHMLRFPLACFRGGIRSRVSCHWPEEHCLHVIEFALRVRNACAAATFITAVVPQCADSATKIIAMI